jgi:hypothetical protein
MHKWLQSVHISWHIACISLGILIGVALSLMLRPTPAATVWLCVSLILIGMVSVKRGRVYLGVALVAGVFLGMWRGQLERSGLSVYEPYYGRVSELRGTLRDDVSFGIHGDQRFELQEVQINEGPRLHGQVWVSIADQTTIRRGDKVTVRGTLAEGFGSISA